MNIVQILSLRGLYCIRNIFSVIIKMTVRMLSANFLSLSLFVLYFIFSYYHRHGEFAKAATLMSQLARSPQEAEIGTRIAHLQKAVASAEKSIATSAGSLEGQLMSENLLDLKDTLEIAGWIALSDFYTSRAL